MKEVPSAVSFKELSIHLNAASLGSSSSEDGADDEAMSFDWAQRVSSLLDEVEQSASIAAEAKTVDQVMALGAFRTHLMLSLQAIKAADL